MPRGILSHPFETQHVTPRCLASERWGAIALVIFWCQLGQLKFIDPPKNGYKWTKINGLMFFVFLKVWNFKGPLVFEWLGPLSHGPSLRNLGASATILKDGAEKARHGAGPGHGRRVGPFVGPLANDDHRTVALPG